MVSTWREDPGRILGRVFHHNWTQSRPSIYIISHRDNEIHDVNVSPTAMEEMESTVAERLEDTKGNHGLGDVVWFGVYELFNTADDRMGANEDIMKVLWEAYMWDN